ncbi:MAG: winged helix-turn-helix domain-containing tetratricopeptide repeat protein [Candidatus Acidiferrales bacterium]
MQEKVRFGEDFELDFRAYQLRRSGRVLKLERIPMEVLLLLVEQPGQLVTREQIVEKVWGEGVFLDTDNSINGAMRKIRQVLKDDPDNPRFILTIAGKGYRFIAPVADAEAETEAASGRSPSSGVDGPQAEAVTPIRTPAWRHRTVLIATTVALIATLAVWFEWDRRVARPQASGEKLMLAVLPFENLTGDPAQDYFSDGLTEEMISQLGNLDPQRLGVIARTSVMRYKQSPVPLDGVGRELGVQYVLEGSVRREADTVRITAQLIQVSDQTHLWARRYDRELSSLLAIQGEIAQAVADEIQLTLATDRDTDRDRAHQASLSPAAVEAYDLYLRGRYFWNKRTAQGFQQAIEYFQQAIAKDPGYARAYAGLADSYALMSSYFFAPPDEVIPKARTAALKALELDEGLAEAHTSLAVIAENYDWDWQTAEKEYRRAIQLDPNYATAHHWYAGYLSIIGRFDEALAQIELARRLDPLSVIIAANHGFILYFSRQYDRAIAQFRALLDEEPDFPRRAHVVIFAYVEVGRFADALADIENWRRVDDTPLTWAFEAYVYARSGQKEQARRAIDKMQAMKQRWPADPTLMLWVTHAGMLQKDKAFAFLERAYAEHSNVLVGLKVDPMYDPLRSDSRFQALLRRMNFPE